MTFTWQDQCRKHQVSQLDKQSLPAASLTLWPVTLIPNSKEEVHAIQVSQDTLIRLETQNQVNMVLNIHRNHKAY